MATYTDNYNLVKPTMAETADIRTINGNMDTVDDIMHASQISLAPAYDSNETYNTGDVVMYEFLMYECLDDDVTGTWDSTKWQRTTAGEHGGGSDVEITPTLATGTKIADFEIDGVSGELYAPSGGGGGGGGSDSKIVDTLWEGTLTAPTTGTDVTLSHNYTDYDVIVVTLGSSGYPYQQVEMYQTDSIVQGQLYVATGWYSQDTVAIVAYLIFNSETSINLKSVASSTPTTYYKIQGIKFGGMLAPMIYSFEEREVGVWVDNKPLYQKSYINVAGAGTSVNVTLSDLSDIETIFIVPQGSNSTDAIPFPYVHYSSANLIGGFFTISNGVPTLAIRRGSDMASVGLKFLTVCYTKTTDVAGSGSYGSLGIPMEHYDDTERVVGTYFGDTLYKKTIRQTNIDGNPSDWTLIETMSGVGEYVKSEAKFLNYSSNKTFSQYYISVSFNNSTKGLYYFIREMGSGVRGDLEVTVYYTKSTT